MSSRALKRSILKAQGRDPKLASTRSAKAKAHREAKRARVQQAVLAAEMSGTQGSAIIDPNPHGLIEEAKSLLVGPDGRPLQR